LNNVQDLLYAKALAYHNGNTWPAYDDYRKDLLGFIKELKGIPVQSFLIGKTEEKTASTETESAKTTEI